MLFNSYEFAVLLAITLVLFYAVPRRVVQTWVLVAASLVFYAWHVPMLLVLFLSSVGINLSVSYGVVFGPPGRRRLLATVGVVVNLLILAAFKYSPLIGKSLFPPGSEPFLFLTTIPLPIGISFFTFEGISLVVDAYKGRDAHAYQGIIPRSLMRHAGQTTLFVAFFPHLISGPILKAHDFIPQITAKFFRDIDWHYCFRNIVLGFFMKSVIADNLNQQTALMDYPYFMSFNSATLLMMLYGYSMQIFSDFAGYSMIAVGIAGLFGYKLIQNFNFPYISRSFGEFWRRWHISLSSFLREYLYIPLGGNRRGKTRTYLNLMATMALGGLWHGAAWSYLVWGSFHGLALALERLLRDAYPAPKRPSLWFNAGATAIVFAFVSLAWLLFRLPNFEIAIQYFTHIGTNAAMPFTPADMATVAYILLYSIPVIIWHAGHLLAQQPAWAARIHRADPFLYGLMIWLIATNHGMGTSFIYFQF